MTRMRLQYEINIATNVEYNYLGDYGNRSLLSLKVAITSLINNILKLLIMKKT